MIYGRFGDPVELVRMAVWSDIRELEHRKGDAQDRKSIANKCYIVTRAVDNGYETIHHIGFLRADEGIQEIAAAVIAIGGGPETEQVGK